MENEDVLVNEPIGVQWHFAAGLILVQIIFIEQKKGPIGLVVLDWTVIKDTDFVDVDMQLLPTDGI